MEPQERATLGRTSLSVTRLGLGTGPIGGLYAPVEEKDAHAIVERSYQIGFRYFDTAPFYGYGDAEQRLGHVLSSKPRDGYVLSTKVGRLLRPRSSPDETIPDDRTWKFSKPHPLKPIYDFSYDGVMRSFEESRERLGIDRVDILYIHDPYNYFEDAATSAYRALDRLRSDGAVEAIGVGVGQAEALVRYAQEADFDCFLLAGQYTLLDQTAAHELLPLCTERNIGIVMGSVFHGGLLAGAQPGDAFHDVPVDVREKLDRLQTICERFDVPLKAAALQFPLGHPAVVSVLTGVRSVDELEENVRLFQHPIPAEFWEELRREWLLTDETPFPPSSSALQSDGGA